MVELDQMKIELQNTQQDLKEAIDALNIPFKKQRIEELSREMEAPDFWSDADRANNKMKELRADEKTVGTAEGLTQQYQDIMDLIAMGNEDNDPSAIEDVRAELDDYESQLEELRLSTLLTGEYDHGNAIIELNAGAGGTEACDWCQMLFRMYSKWADKKGYSLEVTNMIDGDEAGLKSVGFQISGENAYGFLRSEHGVHRLVRMSPFNAQGKRQTSFVSCYVMPELDASAPIEINPDDIRIDTYRSSGAGGQHINKTSSAIRITHFPTGIVVTCQNERSQFQNKDKAFEILRARLFMRQQEEEEQKRKGIAGELKDNAFGSQIRSYVLQPYTLVKDTRTEAETSDAQGVLDGDIDRFINAYLKMGTRPAQAEV